MPVLLTVQVIIIGAGPTGLAAALKFYQTNGITSIVYESRREPNPLGGPIGIVANGLRLLDRLGVYRSLLPRAAITSKVTYRSSAGRVLCDIDLNTDIDRRTGYGSLEVARPDLAGILLDAIRAVDIPVYYEKTLTSVRENDKRVTVTSSDGSTDTADLLLGCDGTHSAVRSLYVDPGTEPVYTTVSGIFSMIPTANLTQPIPAIAGRDMTLTFSGKISCSPCTAAHDHLYWIVA